MLATRNKTDDPAHYVWEDKEIKFDTPNLKNRYRNGEKVLATINHIEDSKGNPGDTGTMLATNLRIIWHSLVHKKFNLSIGYGRIVTLSTKTVFSKVRGTTQALYVLGAGDVSRFEFLFTDVSGETTNNSVFSCIFDIHHLYQKTILYRELKLRSAILRSGQLILLPQEQIYSTLCGVWNLSSDQGNLGSFVVTNIRIVWFADVNENFNISLPYMQISNIKIRESKYGDALVVQTSHTGGGYVLGFRIDPVERLNEIYKELTSLFSVYSEAPNFGVNYILEGHENALSSHLNNNNSVNIEEFQEIDEVQEREVNSKLTAYLAEGHAVQETLRSPVYCKELGFAMEQIRDGYKLNDLWEIVNTNALKPEAN